MADPPNSHGGESPIAVVVNGVLHHVDARTLDALVSHLGYGDGRVATAVNGSFIPAAARSDVPLVAGDRVEIVSPRQGG